MRLRWQFGMSGRPLRQWKQAPQRDFIPLAERLKFYASRDLADADAAKLIEGKSEAVAGY
jgi:hypothetical protein